MKTKFLFPSFFRYIGFLLAAPGFALGYFVMYTQYSIEGFGFQLRQQRTLFQGTYENFTNELALTLVIVGLLFIAFSKIKKEDELTGKIRLNALYWAVLANFMWYAVFILLAFGNNFFKLALITSLVDTLGENERFMAYNLFAPLLIFILRFYYLLYKNQNDYSVAYVGLMRYNPFNLIGKWLSIAMIVTIIINKVFLENTALSYAIWFLPLAMLIWVYAKEKDEDEYIKALRLDAMQIAVYVNYAVLLISNFAFYSTDFFVVQVVNLVTIPLIFQARFQYCLYRLRVQDARSGLNLCL